MTPERIAELRALAEKATPGPWTVWDTDADSKARGHLTDKDRWMVQGFGYTDYNGEMQRDDAAFIAAARTALPEALDYAEAGALFVRALQEPIFFNDMVMMAIHWPECPFSQAQLHAFRALEGPKS